jgi:uncharacterized membrane protein YdjX (TVP38/TMEM64 family)
MKNRTLRWLPLIGLALGFAAFFALGLHRHFTFETLAQNRSALHAWAGAHPVLAPLVYMLLYVAVVAFSIPGAAILTVAGGFLFGAVLGALYAIVGATIGATSVFLIARTALGDLLRAKAGGAVQRMEAGFRTNALSYLLVLRLVPLFPFFVVNLVPAFLGIGLGTFVIATFFGIIPATFVIASIGNGLGTILDAGGMPDLGILFEPAILLPILGLAALALVPVVYKHLKGRA